MESPDLEIGSQHATPLLAQSALTREPRVTAGGVAPVSMISHITDWHGVFGPTFNASFILKLLAPSVQPRQTIWQGYSVLDVQEEVIYFFSYLDPIILI